MPRTALQRAIQRDEAVGEVAGGAAGGQVSSATQSSIQCARAGGQRLDAKTSLQMGQAFGKDFGGVKIHTDAKADSISRSLNAKAFTTGQDIFFRKNQYNPNISSGQKLLAHELTHVVQQGGGGSAVQTKLTVGATNDRYEQEADHVANQVTQRLANHTQTNVQTKQEPGQKPQTVQPQVQRQTLAPVQVQHRVNHQGKIARSFQQRATEFERSLGLYAFHHPKANAVAKTMSDRIVQYLGQKEIELNRDQKKVDALWQKAGGSSGDIAGSVGDDVATIKKVFQKGNLRERMTHIHNFMDHHFGNFKHDKPDELSKIAANPKAITELFSNLANRTGESDELYFGDAMHKGAPIETSLAQQGQIRERSGQVSTTSMTVGDVGFAKEGGLLSKREARLMYKDLNLKGPSGKDQIKDKQLAWSEGARVWKMKQSHEWVQTMQGLDLPMMAGPSAHTNAFMNIAKLFGIKDLASVRLAAIGQLLPINAHSLVEIMIAASGHGVPFTQGPEMYRSIAPLKQKELRNNVGKGSFPDEFGSATSGTGGEYRKLLDKYTAVMKLFSVPPDEADPMQQLAKLTELDNVAIKHIANKRKEKSKLKLSNVKEINRLDARIKGVEEMRLQINSKMDQVKKTKSYSRHRIAELNQNKAFDDKLFHGTHTGLLPGLEKSKGTLISAKELEKRGIMQASGEGDFFSNGKLEERGPKEFISVGLGDFGMGTALAYAQAAGTLRNYNIERYKDDELATEVFRLQEAIDNYDASLISMRETEREYKTKRQLEGLRDRLKAEIDVRAKLPKDHPRRKGELSDNSNFPLLFEFENRGLDVRDDGGYALNEGGMREAKLYNKEMLGERMIYGGTVDLKPLLVRVYCPMDKMDVVSQKISTIMGRTDIEVLAMEALLELPENTPIGGVRNETYAMQVEFEDVRKDVISGYAQAMKTKQKFDNPRLLAKQYTPTPSPKSNSDVDSVTKDTPKPKTSPDVDTSTSTSPKVEPKIEVGPPTEKVSSGKEKTDSSVKKGSPSESPLTTTLSGDGLRFHKIDGDGDCLFAAVLHQLGQQGAMYKNPMDLRSALAQHIISSPIHYQQTVLAPIFAGDGMTVQQAAMRIQTPGYWSGLVGDTAPQLLANLLQRPLLLYRTDGSKQTVNPVGDSLHGPLRLVYNGTSHYDSTAPSGVDGPIVSKIVDSGGGSSSDKPIEVVSTPKVLDKETDTDVSVGSSKPLVEKLTDTVSSPPVVEDSKPENKPDPKPENKPDTTPPSVPKPRNDLTVDSDPGPLPKKGKPRIVLSGHGLLDEKTTPTKTKVPSKMSISFTGPMGSILDNPLANAVEQNTIRPEDIFLDATDMHTGDVTEIEPHEIMKLYKIFGPRTVKGGKNVPNYTLTPPKGLDVQINNQVFTVGSNHTLQQIFPILGKLYPKGVNIEWAACQDLPSIDRRFQLKIMNVKDRYAGPVKRSTTTGENRKQTIKLIAKMIKDFDNI